MPGPDRAQKEPDRVHRADGPEERERLYSRDEAAVGWGDERDEPSDDEDVARLLADRPPHHDRF